MIDELIKNLNENKLFIGFMMIIVTIGGRYIITELNDSQKKLIHSQWMRKVFIFCAFFMATRDIYCSLTLTILFVIIISGLFNNEDGLLLLNNEEEEKEEYNDKKIDTLIEELNQLKKVL